MTFRAIEWPWSQTSFRKVPEKIIMTYVVVFWFVYLLLLLVFRRNQLFITFALFKTLNEIITLFTLPAALTANSSRVHIGVIKVSVIKTGSTSFCLHIEDVHGSKFQLQTRSSALFWNDSASLSWKSFIGRGPFSNRHSCVCWAYASYREDARQPGVHTRQPVL